MSDEITKQKHSKRIHKKEAAIAKQTKIAKAYGMTRYLEQPNRYAKRHAMNCGHPGCALCGNPRKIFGEKTMQEQRFEQSSSNDVQNEM